MDMIHYSPEINRIMLESVVLDKKRVAVNNVEEALRSMRETYQYIIEEGIYMYY